jgi:diguanylate cyclase (GGDEF)-like protein
MAKLLQEISRQRRGGHADLYSVRREGAGQVVLVGPACAGKSSLLQALTGAAARIAEYPFTTQLPQPAMMPFEDIQVQLVDLPAAEPGATPAWMRGVVPQADLALLVIDLDGLKRINDLGGHPAGDEALRAAADALRMSCRLGDVPCRLGGDEFAVILPGAEAAAAELVAERAQRRLRELGKGQYSFSGGVAMSGDELATPYELYRTADIAAYRAKTAGGARTLVAQTP